MQEDHPVLGEYTLSNLKEEQILSSESQYQLKKIFKTKDTISGLCQFSSRYVVSVADQTLHMHRLT